MGANLRRLRGDHRLEDLAYHARVWGLKWSTGTAANCEAGRSAPSIVTIYVLTLALEDMLGRPVTPTELFEGDHAIETGAGDVELEALRTVLSNDRPKRPRSAREAVLAWTLEYVLRSMTEADERIGRDLGLDPDRAAAEMYTLWGRPLTAVRDEIAGEGANAQRRGIVTRQLKADLRRQVTDGDN